MFKEIYDMASFANKSMNFANPIVEIAASSQVGVFIWPVGKLGLGCSLTDIGVNIKKF